MFVIRLLYLQSMVFLGRLQAGFLGSVALFLGQLSANVQDVVLNKKSSQIILKSVEKNYKGIEGAR